MTRVMNWTGGALLAAAIGLALFPATACSAAEGRLSGTIVDENGNPELEAVEGVVRRRISLLLAADRVLEVPAVWERFRGEPWADDFFEGSDQLELQLRLLVAKARAVAEHQGLVERGVARAQLEALRGALEYRGNRVELRRHGGEGLVHLDGDRLDHGESPQNSGGDLLGQGLDEVDRLAGQLRFDRPDDVGVIDGQLEIVGRGGRTGVDLEVHGDGETLSEAFFLGQGAMVSEGLDAGDPDDVHAPMNDRPGRPCKRLPAGRPQLLEVPT